MPRHHISASSSALDIATSNITISPVPGLQQDTFPLSHFDLPNAPGQPTVASFMPSPIQFTSNSDCDPAQEFLEQCRAPVAGHYLNSNGQDMAAIHKRHAQVANTIAKAKERISRLGLSIPIQKHRGRGFKEALQQHIYKIKRSSIWGLWVEQLKEIEGSFGSAVMITFAFLQWVFLLDLFLTFLWIGAIVVPFFLQPPTSYHWSGIKNFFQADGLEKSWIYYGGYFYKTEQNGWYKTDYMYPCTIIAMFLVSLVAILSTIAKRIMGSGDTSLVSMSDMYPYSTLVFTSWDFRITSLEASTKLRKGIRMQLREMLADSSVKDQKIYGLQSKLKLYKRYAVLGILWPMVMAGTVAAVIFLVSNSELINTKLKTEYAQAALLTILVSILGPFTVRLLVSLEDWKPLIAERVVIIKLFFLRALNISTLLYRLYVMLDYGYMSTQSLSSDACIQNSKCPHEGFLCCTSQNDGVWNTCSTQLVGFCASTCMENEVGKQLLRLIVTTTVINCLLDIGMGIIFIVLLNRKQELAIADFSIDTVYLQVLIWVGSHFSPIAPAIGMVCNLLTFYSKKLTLKTCTPMQKLYSASRTSSLTYGVLLVALILSVIPETVFMTNPSSGICGPIKANVSMYQTLSQYIQHASNPVWLIVEWIGSPTILGGTILLLLFIIMLLRAKLIQSYQYLEIRMKEYDLRLTESQEIESDY